jgi:hypothetical protein
MRLQNGTTSACGRLHCHSRQAPLSRYRVISQTVSRTPGDRTVRAPSSHRRAILPDR